MHTHGIKKKQPAPWVATPKLAPKEFDLFREVIAEKCGIQLSDAKVQLVQSRVGKRLRATTLESFCEYYRYLMSLEGQQKELPHFLAAITTNETHFFREPQHFEILTRHLLPNIVSKTNPKASLRVWSAGCSTGQEVYTLVMILNAWAQKSQRRFSVVGSDIDHQVLEIAKVGRYPLELKKEIPVPYASTCIDIQEDTFSLKPTLKSYATFCSDNFAHMAVPKWPRCDIIFCRNVIMYLKKETRLHLARVFRASLREGGYLIIGASESLHGLPTLFDKQRYDKSLIYQRHKGIGDEP